mgnify:CR=1 FL=1
MFSKILRTLREEKNVSQQAMADYLQISRQAYNYYELGRREPSYDTLKSLAKYFGVTTDYLLGLSDTRYPAENDPVDKSPTIEIDDLTEESKKELEKYIHLLKLKDQMDKGKEEQSSALEKKA